MPTAKQLARLLAPHEARASVALDGETQTWAPGEETAMATVREIVMGWLREHGYDGLWCPMYRPGRGDPNESVCVCDLDNLMDPGGEGVQENSPTELIAPCDFPLYCQPRHRGEHEEDTDGDE